LSAIMDFASFPFAEDENFQQGLANILANNKDLDPQEAELRARVFYFNRVTGSSLNVDQVRQSNKPAEPEFLTFTQLQELIESGRVDEIPNNKVISGELNSDAPSQSTTTLRKKPWE
ncbi:hypothetical protein C8J56DRAFT_745171, partial [Mycena floridula]